MDAAAGRSKIATKFGIVAASQPLAARAGVQVLEHGGNAIDAAIAANAVMGLVEPHMNGIGGDLFAIVYDAASGKLFGLNASGWAPKALTPAFLRSRGVSEMPAGGIHTVTVPGAVAGWESLRARFGRLPLSEILAPAIFYAENGFPVSDIVAATWAGLAEKLAGDPNAARTYLPHGRAPRAGEVFKNAELAASLRLIAREGPAAFYNGQIADAILELSSQHGGTMTAADLSEFEPEWVEPDIHDLSRLDGLRAAAQHAGHRRAADAQSDGAVSAGRVRIPQRRGAARDDRSEEAGLRRHAAVCRRSPLRDDARSRHVEQGARQETRAARSIRPGRRRASSRRCSTA